MILFPTFDFSADAVQVHENLMIVIMWLPSDLLIRKAVVCAVFS